MNEPKKPDDNKRERRQGSNEGVRPRRERFTKKEPAPDSGLDLSEPKQPIKPKPQVPGINIKGYAIEEKVRKEGDIIILKAKQISMDRAVLLKVLPYKDGKPSKRSEDFLKNARTISQLNHPNIIAGIEVGEGDGLCYFAMEYFKGQNLAQQIKMTGTIPEWKAIRIIAQITTALEHAAQKGLFHGDLTPINVIYTDKNEVKLANIGMASEKPEEQELMIVDEGGEAAHKYYFSSPEQIQRQKCDIRTDIYCLGSIFYYILTGAPPFMGATALEVMGLHQTAPVPNLFDTIHTIDPETDKIIKRMMAKKPAERYQTPTELLNSLAPLLKKKPQDFASTKSGAVPLPEKPIRPARAGVGAMPNFESAPAVFSEDMKVMPKQASSNGIIAVSTIAVLIILALLAWNLSIVAEDPALREERDMFRKENESLKTRLSDNERKYGELAKAFEELRTKTPVVRVERSPNTLVDKGGTKPKVAGDGSTEKLVDKGADGEIKPEVENPVVEKPSDTDAQEPKVGARELIEAKKREEDEKVFAEQMKRVNFLIISYKFDKAMRLLKTIDVFPEQVKEKEARILAMGKVKAWMISYLEKGNTVSLRRFSQLESGEDDLLVGANEDKMNIKSQDTVLSLSWNTFSTDNIYKLATICMEDADKTGENLYALGVFCIEMGLLDKAKMHLNAADTKGFAEAKVVLNSLKQSVVLIKSSPVGAVVYIGGEKKGITPCRITLDDGEYTLLVKKKGYSESSLDIALPPKMGTMANVDVRLEKERAADELVDRGGDAGGEPKKNKKKAIPFLFKQPELNVTPQSVSSMLGKDNIEFEEKKISSKISNYYYIIKEGGNAIGGAFLGSYRGFVDNIIVLVLVDTKKQIIGVKVIQHREGRPGGAVGDEYMKEFVGKKSANRVKNVSGATFTSLGVKNSVKSALKIASTASIR